MAELGDWLRARSRLHPVAFAAEAHYRLVTIHPFIDGNGRTARLLMNLLLLQRGYPPAIIRPRDRVRYLGCLEAAQLGGPKTAYESLIARAGERSLDIYLDAAGSHRQAGRTAASGSVGRLMKIGQLAKSVGETVPTIRHWASLGLLDVAQTTTSGYLLFAADAIDRCRRIQSLKGRRLTLAAIGTEIRGA
jgi:hypothetical protein